MTDQEKCAIEKLAEEIQLLSSKFDEHVVSNNEMFFGSKDYDGIVTTLKVVMNRLSLLSSVSSALLIAVLIYFLKSMFLGG